MLEYKAIQDVNAEISSIEVKGKSYAMVNSRIDAFRKICPNGSISTEIVAMQDGIVTMKATVCDEEGRLLGTGYAQEKETSSYINKTSYVENCETSAVGRALGMCGIGVADSIASAEELVNAINNQGDKKRAESKPRKATQKAENKPVETLESVKHNFIQRCTDNGLKAQEILEQVGWSIDKGKATMDDYKMAEKVLDKRIGVQS